MRDRTTVGLWSLALVACLATAADAGTITFTNTQVVEGGTGYGNVNHLLILHRNDTEHGAVTWNGSDSVRTGHADPTSDTRTSAEIRNGTLNEDMALIFNGGQTGSSPSITLHDFNLLHFDAAGTLLETITWNSGGGLTLDLVDQGAGKSGWLFRVSGISLAAADDRWGMEVLSTQAVSGTNDGPDSFYVTSLPSITPTDIAAVPLPSSAWMGMAFLGALGALRLARRRRAASL